MLNIRKLVGSHDILFVTLDTLRFDVASNALERGLTPGLASLLPDGRWELRHSPGNFTYAAHQAFFAGFLPTPTTPGPHPRLFATTFEGSESITDETCVLDAPDIIRGLAQRGYRTVCIGGVGFFNKRTPLSSVLPGMFQESYWCKGFGVTCTESTRQQVEQGCAIVKDIAPTQRLFLFLNVSAMHQPNCIFADGATQDSPETQAAALAYVDRQLPRLIACMQARAPLLVLLCSDHGTAYGEDGHRGHRISHPVVWNVPYAEFVLPQRSGGCVVTAADLLSGSPYGAYGYSYPHKTAYRPLLQPRPLRDVWAGECKSGLFLYLHVPFCERRCGFCNLLATSRADHLCDAYIGSLQRQAQAIRDELGDLAFARMAVGGGTPTFLNPGQLERLLGLARDQMGARLGEMPTSVECSPSTTTREKLAVLRDFGVDRVSIGVQVFDEAELRALGRPQNHDDVHRALGLIREAGFSTLNIDLIYGGDGQTVQSWLTTLTEALCYTPEEIYLYPLYVRPLTGLGLQGRAWDDQRLAAYRAGRDLLGARGYHQISMRMFRAASATKCGGPVYCCQTDGMVGLGSGARSYTRSLHYSGAYAVRRPSVLSIIEDFIRSPDARFRHADYGFELNEEEQRRRFVTKSLLQCQGLDRAFYASVFGRDALVDMPALVQLTLLGLAEMDEHGIRLTDAGLERSDAIAPWLYSERVRNLMESYVLQ